MWQNEFSLQPRARGRNQFPINVNQLNWKLKHWVEQISQIPSFIHVAKGFPHIDKKENQKIQKYAINHLHVITTRWTPVDSTNHLNIKKKHKCSITDWWHTNQHSFGDSMPIHTSKGFDQENKAPDKASETQSAGVPEYKNRHQILLL